MSYHDYRMSLEIAGQEYPFAAIIMAAIRQADTDNLNKLIRAFPWTYHEFVNRYKARDGHLLEDTCPRPNAICSGAKSLTPTTT